MMQWDDIYFQNGNYFHKIHISGPTVQSYNSMSLKLGIASVEMPLSKHPVLGEWKILARYQVSEID